MANLTHTLKQGEIGKIISFTLSDADGPVDLTNYTVTMRLRRGVGPLVVNDAEVTKLTQSGATLGQCYHTWDSATAAIPVGTYRGEIKAVNGPNVLYFPVGIGNGNIYFTVIVQPPLG